MSDTFSKVEVITGVARRRRFPTDLKLAIVAETMQPGMAISYVSDQGERKPVPSRKVPGLSHLAQEFPADRIALDPVNVRSRPNSVASALLDAA
jgi:hypothetical protein